MKEWNPSLIKDYLNEMNKENLMIFLEAKEVEKDCNLVEPIYQTKFAIADLDGLEPRVCPVAFPERNPFIPVDFSITELGKQTTPQTILKNDQYEVFFKKDHRFELPKMVVMLKLYFEGINTIK